MKKTIVIGVMLGIAGLGEHAPAQTPKPPHAIAAQTQGEAKPAADELITLLETKGILTETEAALFRHTELLPESRQVLAEMLLSKHLISKKEYDETLRSCSGSAAQVEAASQYAAPYILEPNGKGEPGGLKSLSDWIASILPGGGQTTDLDFGTIQPSPMWPQGDQPEHAHAKVKHKSRQHHEQDGPPSSP